MTVGHLYLAQTTPYSARMKLQHVVVMALALGGCKESFKQVEDPNLPIMAYYALPG